MASSNNSVVISTALGLTVSTVFVTMNTTLNHIAIPAYFLANPVEREKQDDKDQQERRAALLLRQWALTYSRGHLIGPGAALFSPLCFLYASFYGPAHLTTFYRLAALSAFAAFPFTVVFILKINIELFRRVDLLERTGRDDSLKEKTEPMTSVRRLETAELMRKCFYWSQIRAWLPLPGILLGFYCLAQL